MADGCVRLHGKPSTLISQLEGQIWRKIVPKEQSQNFKETLNVISSQLITGKTQLTVHSDIQPALGFEPVQPTLEDVYFTTLFSKSGKELHNVA
jgi:hypothetical protein